MAPNPAAALIWRDFTIQGNPISGAYRPDKAEVRAWSGWVETSVDSLFSTLTTPATGVLARISSLQANVTTINGRIGEFEGRIDALEAAAGFDSTLAPRLSAVEAELTQIRSGPITASLTDKTLAVIKADGTHERISFADLEQLIMPRTYAFDASATVGAEAFQLISDDPNRAQVELIPPAGGGDLLMSWGSPPEAGALGTFTVAAGLGYQSAEGRKEAVWVKSADGSDVQVSAFYTNRSNINVNTQNTIDRYIAAGSGAQTSTERAAITRLLTRLGAVGFLGGLGVRRCLLLGNSDPQSSLIDIVTLQPATVFGTVTHVPHQGFRGDGTTGYINTNYTPLSDPRFTKNNHSLGVYVSDLTIQSTSKVAMGAGSFLINANRTSTAAAYRSATASSDVVTVGGRGGLFALSRANSVNYRATYNEATQVVATPSTSSPLNAYPLLILANNGASGANSFANLTPLLAFAGPALPDAMLRECARACAEYRATFGG